MVDTHAHLQFSAFEGKVKEIIDAAQKAGVNTFIIPSTDIPTSKKAIEISSQFENVYAAVGIHPHHVYQMVTFPYSSSEAEGRIEKPSKNKFSTSSNNTDELVSLIHI